MSIISWLSGVSGDWTRASGWSGGALPGSAATALIAAPGSYVVTLFGAASVGGLTVAAPGAEFYDAGLLSLSGSLALQAGTLALAYGTLAGGTLVLGGGVLQSTGGTLASMSVHGTLDLSAAQTTLFVTGGLSLSNSGGSGAGSISLTGGYSALDFVGSQTLANATISLGAAGGLSAPGAATLAFTHAGGAISGATLTLASSLWVRQAAGAGVNGVIAVGSIGGPPGANLPDGLVNQGTITAAVWGATLDILGSGNFNNQGTLGVSNGATLEIATAGFTNSGSISVSNATLAFGGTFAAGLLSNLGAVSVYAGQVEILGTADNTGGTLAVGTGSRLASLGPLELAGTILNGVVLDSGQGLSFSPATGVLDGTSYVGTLNLAGAGAGVTLTDGAQVSGAGGAPGTIIDTGAGSVLLLRGSEVLDNATILLGSAAAAASISTTDLFLASSATTATLGAHLSVQQTGSAAALQANGWSPVPGFGAADTLINQGTISGSVAGGNLSLSGYGTFVNQGTISVGGGDTLSVTVAQFANAGVLNDNAGGTVLLGQRQGYYGTAPAWSNAGQISVNGGTLVLAGTVQTSQLGTITETSGQVQLAGTLSNAGATLTLGTHGTKLSLTGLGLSGTIQGGTIQDNAGLLAADSAGNAMLDGVSYQGTLTLIRTGSFLRVRDGLALTGAANVLGAGSVLDFVGSQTIDHAQILLGAAGIAASLDLTHDPARFGADTLTLGSGLVVIQAGPLATIGRGTGTAGDAIVNAGTISGAVAGGTLTLGGANFVNQGRINVSNGDTLCIAAPSFSNTGSISLNGASLSIGGSLTLAGLGAMSLIGGVMSVSGTLDIGGGTFQIGQASAVGRVSLTGMLRNGTIVDAGGGLACSGAADLSGIAYVGTLDLSRPFSQLAFGQGLTVTAATGGIGSILLTAAQGRLIANASSTLNNVAVSLGSAAQIYNGQRLAPPELAAAAGVQLTLGAACTVQLAGTAGVLGDAALGQWSDSIVSAGQISSTTAGGTLSLAATFFTNTGTISASAHGAVAIGDVSFVNAGVLSIGAGSAVLVGLYEYYAAPNAGAAVFTNTGTILMNGGVFQEQTSGGLFPAVPVVNAAGATLRGSGLILAQIANAGTIEAQGGLLNIPITVLGNGSLQIDAGATLELGAPEPASETIRFASNTGTLKVDQPATFAGTISGFGAGDVISLPNQVLTGIGINNGTLVASMGTQNYRFASTAPIAGALSAVHGANGGTTISLTPQTVGTGSGSGGAPALIAVGQPRMLFWASPAGDVFQGSSANIMGAHIGSWSAADSLDITDMVSASARLSLVQAPGLDTLTITDGTHTTTLGLACTSALTTFHLSSDGHGGTALTFHP